MEKGKISIDTPAKASFDTLLNTVAINITDDQGRLKQSRVALQIKVGPCLRKSRLDLTYLNPKTCTLSSVLHDSHPF